MSNSILTLADVCVFIEDCLHATAPIQEEGFPLIRTPNIGKGRLNLEGAYRISQDTYEKWTRRARPEPDDLILAREAPAGNVALIQEGQIVALGQRTVHLRPDKEQVDPSYLCYYLLTPRMQGALLAGATGATAKHVNMKDIRRLVLPLLHERQAQTRIGRAVAAYDDLIEVNRRRIKLLEEAARLIYREWFVHLRFPGYENSKIENGLPAGWREMPIEGALESHIGGGWGQEDPLEQEIEPAYVIRGTDFPAIAQGEFGKVGLRYHKPGPLTKRILSAGDIIFEVSGGSATQPIARTVYLTDRLIAAFDAPIICASFCKKFRPHSVELGLYLDFTFKEDRENGKLLIYQKQSASALLNYNFEAFLAGYRVWVPCESVLNEFYKAVFPLLDLCSVLAMQNKKLREARDLLLPRLMSGEIEV